MKTITLSLDVQSSVITLSEIARIMGLPTPKSSFDKGTRVRWPRKETIVTQFALWRRCFREVKPERLPSQLENVLLKYKTRMEQVKTKYGDRVSRRLTIAVFFETPNARIELPLITRFDEFVDKLEFVAYVCGGS